MTKAEWKECDRWRRITQKALLENEKALIARLCEVGIGDVLKARMAEDIINPPILLGPMYAQ